MGLGPNRYQIENKCYISKVSKFYVQKKGYLR